ncbi:hypothetical protein DOTSEDRAFT_55328 [Dothistroma septosporum NZE10]|uniref:non-specific serine/threonine protein kinase n=1 Tax=Dothistroma septosporum (strain NZE10 / CBS 128990) TaxID=675120 RepID=N1PJ04_DOTSN|nr:hypothetical protein DOTSEDRAFT_55328 [Dothistroma septosporum NZE10]
MARRTVAVNGRHTNGDAPPPSTLAAQIVQNHGETATFGDMLQEILSDQAAAQENDPQINAQLVSVLLQAGLLPLTADNPFANSDGLLQQARDSITVIERTLKRQPEVVVTQLTPNGPQLFLSLLATLASLCGRSKCQDLGVHGLLSSICAGLDKSLHHWKQAHVLREIIQESVDDAFLALEALAATSTKVSLTLPPARSVGRLWSQGENSITAPPGTTATIHDAARAFTVAMELSQVGGLVKSWFLESNLRLQQAAYKLRSSLEKAELWQPTLRYLETFAHDHNNDIIEPLLQETAKRQDVLMADGDDLSTAFQQQCVLHPGTIRRRKPAKRRRISREELCEPATILDQRTAWLAGGAEAAHAIYLTMSNEEKCAAWQSLLEHAQHDLEVTYDTVLKLIALPELHNTKDQRVLSMYAVAACAQNLDGKDQVTLGTSELWQYCLQSLRSSTRELRIAASRALPCFLRHGLPEKIRDDNRQLALEYLRTLSDRDVASEQETLISAWGQVAIACGDKELNLVLLRLVDYLGHANNLICGLAAAEIDAIASARGIATVAEMFQPFWRSIAVSAVQDLPTRPNKTQQLCDLLNMDVDTFLSMTQRDTLPSLVLTKKQDIMRRVAHAAGRESVRDVCLQPITNLAAILSLLLMQSSGDVEDFVLACLTAVDPGFRDVDLAGLIRLEPVQIACELLKLCADESDNRKSKAYQAFQNFANIEQAAHGQRKTYTKASRAVIALFDKHILGILTTFSTILETGPDFAAEKIRCLKGIEEIFTLTKGNVSVALPQIRACLHVGLDQPALYQVAFGVWLSLVDCLPHSEDVAEIVDETFVLIVRHWPTISDGMRQKVHSSVSSLVKTHNITLTENIMTLPSLHSCAPLLNKFASEFQRLKDQESVESHCKAFTRRLRAEGDKVVQQALIELIPFLEINQGFMHETAASEHPSGVLPELLSALLDVTVKYSNVNEQAAELCGKALGIIGCVDPNRVEATRKKRQVLVLSNFDTASEVIDWILALFEDVLVKAFKSVTNAKAQGILAYTMQELLSFCNFGELSQLRPRASQAPEGYQRWYNLPEHVRTTLTPFLSSRYFVVPNKDLGPPNRTYPDFSPEHTHDKWLRSLTFDLMHKAKGDNAKAAFSLVARLIRFHDLAIARFVLPYAILNVVIGGTVPEVEGLTTEFLALLRSRSTLPQEQESIRLCSESVFGVLDYLATWLRGKKQQLAATRTEAYKTGHSPAEFDEARDMGQIETVEIFLASIPADIIAEKAVDCRSYARALFHWEQHIRKKRSLIPSPRMTEQHESLYDKLQDIYSQIDEPDGLEGLAVRLPIISEDQQAFNHAKSGRWTAAQAWYELQLAEQPTNTDLQHSVLRCLQETGQYASLLNYARNFSSESEKAQAHLALMAEASWMVEDADSLFACVKLQPEDSHQDFNIGIADVLLRVGGRSSEPLEAKVGQLRQTITRSLSMASTDSLQLCHSELLKLHVLYEVEIMAAQADPSKGLDLLKCLDKRLTEVGSYVQDKQYLLGVRRAIMRLRPSHFPESHVGTLWLTTARLARQAKNTSSSYKATLKAFECGLRESKLEEARLLWHEGHQRQALRLLENAIESGMVTDENVEADIMMTDVSLSTKGSASEINGYKQDRLNAKAVLLLAKWLDASGQSQTQDMSDRYQLAARRCQRWEKGHYYLGKHYGKLLNAQKALPKEKQAQTFATGELVKLVIDNTLRSIPFGNKYWHETIPRVLTLWMELGSQCVKKEARESADVFDKRVKTLQATNKQLQKYFERVPPYVFYHALPQLISRITHPHPEVWRQLCNILTRIASSHPSQALWSLVGVVRAADRTRIERGTEVLNKIRDPKTKPKNSDISGDLKTLVHQGQRLCDGLLQASEAPVEPRAVKVKLGKDLGFNHKLAPSQLVVPVEATLTASAPATANSETIRRHRAFAQDKVTIQAFTDDVLVLNSLQRPRKITARGSDGKLYGLLCKPKDDLRKDQRLMEFNGIINRALKRSPESSKRRLYIKTYAVTPLSEESGTIEWVEGIKPIRDILLGLYGSKGIRPNYNEIKKDLDMASSAPEHAHIFAEKVLIQFPPSLHEWFTETYPEPDTWMAARLRYARSAAVMSMAGHILGLGDRHGENILLEEGTGGVFHVDFNCLFDKGLTFEKPELVPFRLTPNMVDAMGSYGHEGPFRKSCELTLSLLRQERDTLMTVLETFLYDPTTDFVGKKKRSTAGVPETPAEILESVSTKLKGLLRGETVALSAEGYVDALIQEAVSHFNLASMYIGWCSFL